MDVSMDEYGNNIGETLLPECESLTTMDIHNGRYRWAAQHIEGGRVLDVGCGIGYGSVALLEKCEEYVGFDCHPGRKKRADVEYAGEHATFITHSANDPFPMPDDSFDAVVCFEAIEHIKKDYHAMAEIARVLKPGRKFFCSTPINYGQTKGHYHIREYSISAFKKLIESQFAEVEYFGQPYADAFVLNKMDEIYICCIAVKEMG